MKTNKIIITGKFITAEKKAFNSPIENRVFKRGKNE